MTKKSSSFTSLVGTVRGSQLSIAAVDFACMECGKRFTTVLAVKRAQSQGCPRCNSGDIDLVAPMPVAISPIASAVIPSETRTK